MGTWYTLVNHTRKEVLSFANFAGMKQGEILGHPVACLLTTWYLFEHVGDRIAFVPDDIEPEWPFPDGSPEDLANYTDVTEPSIARLMAGDWIRDRGNHPESSRRQLAYSPLHPLMMHVTDDEWRRFGWEPPRLSERPAV